MFYPNYTKHDCYVKHEMNIICTLYVTNKYTIMIMLYVISVACYTQNSMRISKYCLLYSLNTMIDIIWTLYVTNKFTKWYDECFKVSRVTLQTRWESVSTTCYTYNTKWLIWYERYMLRSDTQNDMRSTLICW